MVYILTDQIPDMYHECVGEFCKSTEINTCDDSETKNAINAIYDMTLADAFKQGVPACVMQTISSILSARIVNELKACDELNKLTRLQPSIAPFAIWGGILPKSFIETAKQFQSNAFSKARHMSWLADIPNQIDLAQMLTPKQYTETSAALTKKQQAILRTIFDITENKPCCDMPLTWTGTSKVSIWPDESTTNDIESAPECYMLIPAEYD